LGRRHDRIPPTAGRLVEVQRRELIAEAEKYAALGCKHYKMKSTRDPREKRSAVVGAAGAGDGVRSGGREQRWTFGTSGRHKVEEVTSCGTRARWSPTT